MLPNAERVAAHARGLAVVPPPASEPFSATDHYEILRIRPDADEETIDRVYQTLAGRFHPDNPSTGDPETFLRLREAYDTLSDPRRRAQYNLLRQRVMGSARFRLQGREFFDGVHGEQNRRLAALCLLYRQQIANYEAPGLTMLDLEMLTGCTREELGSSMWYLCEKKWATFGDTSFYRITAAGFDVVESIVEDRLEFLALATVRYYNQPAAGESRPLKEEAPARLGIASTAPQVERPERPAQQETTYAPVSLPAEPRPLLSTAASSILAGLSFCFSLYQISHRRDG